MKFQIVPKLPAIDLEQTRQYYEDQLMFMTQSRYPEYLIMSKGPAEIHFFSFPDLDPLTNYAMIYIRILQGIEELYHEYLDRGVAIHPNGSLEVKNWGVKEFSLLDPNHTLLTFGQRIS
ncbi:glyoxalase/bleomycin resistance/extradiol dioxygenase family protein [Algoriphagus sp. AK58]|nr:glyoxalase/bleomycin resistance/extradiol dioxygenase family protein [Algoriphagus sp. AK58]